MYKDKDFSDWTTDDFLAAYDAGHKFSKEEIEQLAWGTPKFSILVVQEEGYNSCYDREMMSVIKVKDRYFGVNWLKTMVEWGKTCYDGPIYELKPVKRTIEVTGWHSIENGGKYGG